MTFKLPADYDPENDPHIQPLEMTLHITLDIPEHIHEAVALYEGRGIFEDFTEQVLRDYIRGMFGQMMFGGTIQPDPPHEDDSVADLMLRSAMLVGMEAGKQHLDQMGIPEGFNPPGRG